MQVNICKPSTHRILAAVLGFGLSISASGTTFPDMPYAGPVPMPDFPTSFAPFNPSITNIAPATGTPKLAEWTRYNQPDDTMVLTGENLSQFTDESEGRDTSFMFYGYGVESEGYIQRLDKRQCALTLPASLPADEMYLLWPRNYNGYGSPVAINQTELWWVGPDIITRDDIFSVYGRQLVLGNGKCHLYLEGYGWLSSISANPYKADFKVPTDLVNGTYKVYAHNGHGGIYGWSSGYDLVVGNGYNWLDGKTINVKHAPYNAKGDGATDDFNAIITALNDAGVGDTVYFPEGTYLISDYLRDDLNDTRIIGDGMDRTFIKTHPSMSRDWMVYGAIKNSVIENLTFGAGTGGSSSMALFRINGSKNTTFSNVCFSQADYTTTQKGGLLYLGAAASHITFEDCKFIAAGKEGTSSTYIGDENTRQIFFKNCDVYGMHDLNTFIAATADEISIVGCSMQNLDGSNPTNSYGWAKGRFIDGVGRAQSSQRNDPSKWYFGSNSINGVSPRNPAPFAKTTLLSFNGAEATVSDASGFVVGKQMLILDGVSEGNYATITAVNKSANTISIDKVGWLRAWAPDPEVGDLIGCRDKVDANSGEMFMCEGSRARYRGIPVSATSTTVTFGSIAGYYKGLQAYIVSGKGQGQAREITDFFGNTITISHPWNVVPDSGSVVLLCEGSSKFVVYGNHFEGTADSLERNVASTGVEIFGTGADWVVDNNTFVSLRQAISEYGYMSDPGGGYIVSPIFSFRYTGNTISNCYQGIERTLRLPKTATSIYEDPLLIGSVFRGNIIKDCIGSAVHYGLETQHKDADVVKMTVWDKNQISNCNKLMVGRAGFFNQVWIGNEFVSGGSSIGLTHLNETSVLQKNTWSGFSQKYYNVTTGSALELPLRVGEIAAGADMHFPVFNSGVDVLNWTATSDSPWLNLIQIGSTVLDENDTSTLIAEMNEALIPSDGSEAVITVSGDSGQVQQLTVYYETQAYLPPPPDEPPAGLLTAIEISGPAVVDEELTAQYICTASYSDGSTAVIDPVWDDNSEFAVIDGFGVLLAGDIGQDELITVSASFEGKTASYDVMINYVPPVLQSISISGPSVLDEEKSAQYDCIALYSDGSTLDIIPVWSENSSATTISDTGLLTAGDVTADTSITVTAGYNGKSDTQTVVISYVPPVLEGLSIVGPGTIDEETEESYSCIGSYSDGTTELVSPSWSENSAYASISGSGLLSAGDVDSDQSVTVLANLGGFSASTTVIINYVAPHIIGLEISGAAEVNEEDSSSYWCEAIYSDGSRQSVNPGWIVSGQASISTSGLLTTGNVTADQNATITATYAGKTDSFSLTIKYVAPTVIGISISGPSYVDEGTSASYSCIASYSDETTKTVVPTWSDNSAYVSINSSGVMTAGDVASDQTVSLTASFDGFSDAHSVTIAYVAPPVVVTQLSITAPSAVKERSVTEMSCTAFYSDGSSAVVNPVWTVDASYAAVDSLGQLSIENIDEDGVAVVTATFDGQDVSRTIDVWAVGTQVIYPLNGFDGKTVKARLWDEAAQIWHELGEMNAPKELVIENVTAGQWYWISIQEYNSQTVSWEGIYGSWISM